MAGFRQAYALLSHLKNVRAPDAETAADFTEQINPGENAGWMNNFALSAAHAGNPCNISLRI